MVGHDAAPDEEVVRMRQLEFRRSRIPALDALEVFVPSGAEGNAALSELRSRTGFSCWRPVAGGHQVLVLYESGEYESTRFSLRKGAWDHENCKRCCVRIEPMTLCWVSTGSDYTILCEDCYRLVSAPESPTSPPVE